MALAIIRNGELIEAVRYNLENSPCYEQIEKLISNELYTFNTYLWGGSVRDPIAEKILGKAIEKRKDFDILVDDSERKNIIGKSKLKYLGEFAIDISAFSDSKEVHGKSKENDELRLSLSDVLQRCDFTVNAMAYDLRNKVIYNDCAIEEIKSQRIDLLCPREEEYKLMCRMVLLAEKLGFEIGERGTQFIKDNYDFEIDERIHDYLHYREVSDKIPFVINKLREIVL